MKDFVSSKRSGVALLASLVVVCAIFAPYGFPWTAPGLVGLTIGAFGLFALGSAPRVRQFFRDVEDVPGLAVAVPERAAMPLGAAPLRFKGERRI